VVDSDLVETAVVTVDVVAVVAVAAVEERPRYAEVQEWQPVTKLGRLVKAGKIKSMEEMYV
jgi:hypothetical protein